MNNHLETAKRLLTQHGYTCVLCGDNGEFHSHLRGVKPLMDFLESWHDFSDFYAADKTVGAGAAHLYVLLGVTAVWANVISEDGINILQQHGIDVFYEKSVPFIINRRGDGACPIETAVKGVADSQNALAVIKSTLKTLNRN